MHLVTSDHIFRFIVGIIYAVVSALVGVVMRRHWEQRKLRVIPQGRRDALRGRWIGEFLQDVGPDGGHLKGRVELEILPPARKVIRGLAKFEATVGGKTVPSMISVEGGFRNDRFATFNYFNRDKATVHFGHLILELSTEGDQLVGRFLGFGFVSKQLVYGTVSLLRDDSHADGPG